MSAALSLQLPPNEKALLSLRLACDPAIAWLDSQKFRSLRDAWKVCPNSNWMLWLMQEAGTVLMETWQPLGLEVARLLIEDALVEEQRESALALRQYLAGESDLPTARAAFDRAAAAIHAMHSGRYPGAYLANAVNARILQPPTETGIACAAGMVPAWKATRARDEHLGEKGRDALYDRVYAHWQLHLAEVLRSLLPEGPTTPTIEEIQAVPSFPF